MACSSGISDVAPPGDEDTGGATDTGGAVDGGGDTSTRDSTISDSSAPDSVVIDAGGPDSTGTGEATPVDATVRTCVVKSATGTSDDCATDEYCDSPDCLSGTCKHRPVSSVNFDPICGCDGITYWNSPWAHSVGHSTGAAGPCSSGPLVKTCGGLTPKSCPAGYECILHGTTPSWCTAPSPQGLCWSLPPDTDCSGGAPQKARLCGAAGTCVSACQAIRKADNFYDDPTCP